MNWLFARGHAADLVVALTVLEGCALAAWRRWAARGPGLRGIAATLLSGIFLALALRCALVGAARAWIGLCLAAALGAHLSDLRWRWPDRGLTQKLRKDQDFS